jgi:hypothetical protein
MLKRIGLVWGLSVLLCVGFGMVGCEDDDEENGNGETPIQIVDLLPGDGEISGWDKGTEPNDFQEAYDEPGLYYIIDGGAQIYIDNGMVSAVQQIYRGSVVSTDAELVLFITDQGDTTNCENLYNEPNVLPPVGTELENLGDEAMIDRSPPFHVSIYFRNDRYFIKITIDKAGEPEAAENIAMAFASNVDSNIP